MQMQHWVKLPNRWIEEGGLRELRWAKGEGSNNQAALMVLMVISHAADAQSGIAKLTYDALCERANLSRAKTAAALKVLASRQLVNRDVSRSTYRLADYDPTSGWAKFPAKGLYANGTIAAFSEFRLRLATELDALKLYFLFASRRDRSSNMAKITYETIEDYSGVPRNRIRKALSLLAAHGLVHIEHVPSVIREHGIASAYRLAHLDTRTHMGTRGKAADAHAMDFQPVPLPHIIAAEV